MERAISAAFGLVLLAFAMTGCAGQLENAPVVSAQQECERSGGIWRDSSCERASGGGGY